MEVQVAFEWGLANRVVPTGSALGAALQMALQLNKFPQVFPTVPTVSIGQ